MEIILGIVWAALFLAIAASAGGYLMWYGPRETGIFIFFLALEIIAALATYYTPGLNAINLLALMFGMIFSIEYAGLIWKDGKKWMGATLGFVAAALTIACFFVMMLPPWRPPV